jgi:hypothetical protein
VPSRQNSHRIPLGSSPHLAGVARLHHSDDFLHTIGDSIGALHLFDLGMFIVSATRDEKIFLFVMDGA